MSISSNLNGVTQLGSWTFTLGAAIPAGANIIGGVTQAGTWTVGLPANAAQESGGNLAAVLNYMLQTQGDLLAQILKELQITNQLLASGLGTQDDPSRMRLDSTFPM